MQRVSGERRSTVFSAVEQRNTSHRQEQLVATKPPADAKRNKLILVCAACQLKVGSCTLIGPKQEAVRPSNQFRPQEQVVRAVAPFASRDTRASPTHFRRLNPHKRIFFVCDRIRLVFQQAAYVRSKFSQLRVGEFCSENKQVYTSQIECSPSISFARLTHSFAITIAPRRRVFSAASHRPHLWWWCLACCCKHRAAHADTNREPHQRPHMHTCRTFSRAT